jgi:hypothetical protein
VKLLRPYIVNGFSKPQRTAPSRLPAPRAHVIRKNIAQPAFQPGQNLVHPLERGALFEVLEPMERRRRNAQFPRKLGVRRLPLLSPQERRKLLVKSARHTGILPKVPFRMRNICGLFALTESERWIYP